MHTRLNAKPRHLALAAIIALAGPLAHADSPPFAGYLNDRNNTALQYYDLTTAQFTSDTAIANNVAIYTFTLGSSGAVAISTSDGAGGVDPYVTLFSGTGKSATFVASNYEQAYFSNGGDISWNLSLAAGTYTVTLGAFANESVGETRMSLPGESVGTLGEGFSGLGNADWVRSGYYQINVIAAAVPEPTTMALMLAGFALVGGAVRRNRSAR